METVFWSLLGLGVYVYAGYPLLLAVLARLGFAQPVRVDERFEPKVTFIVSAFNEQTVIAEKIRNTLALDYPREKLQILVVSDCSSDGTDDIVRGFAGEGVELVRMQERGGKTLGLNEALRAARGDVVVFSDANAMYLKDAVRKLVRNFVEPRVGAVVGESTYTSGEAESERSEGLYWKYETAIKEFESRLGSVVGGDGAIYAIRRELYTPMRADALSDFVNPLQIVAKGYRCLYDRAAQSVEEAGDSFQKEFRRKVRIVNRAWRATMTLKPLLNPFRYGFFAFQLISHKLLRWLIPFVMLALLVVNLLLLRAGPIYVAAIVAQAVFYLLALIGHTRRSARDTPSALSVPYYFCLVNVASAMGIVDAYRGRTYSMWTTVRS